MRQSEAQSAWLYTFAIGRGIGSGSEALYTLLNFANARNSIEIRLWSLDTCFSSAEPLPFQTNDLRWMQPRRPFSAASNRPCWYRQYGSKSFNSSEWEGSRRNCGARS